MSVWPQASPAGSRSLSGSEGALVEVSIDVDPRRLEPLLEALAQVSFPINPEIYHDAAMVYRYAGGREETESATLVEFPAYAARLDEVRLALEANGFDRASVQVTGMLDAIHADSAPEPAPKGAAYLSRRRLKHRTLAIA